MKRLPYKLCIKMRRLYADGMSCWKIGKMLGVSHQTVWRESSNYRRRYLLNCKEPRRKSPFLRYLATWVS